MVLILIKSPEPSAWLRARLRRYPETELPSASLTGGAMPGTCAFTGSGNMAKQTAQTPKTIAQRMRITVFSP